MLVPFRQRSHVPVLVLDLSPETDVHTVRAFLAKSRGQEKHSQFILSCLFGNPGETRRDETGDLCFSTVTRAVLLGNLEKKKKKKGQVA